eukprot:SAG11_NODE_9642_length_893_cov_0.715365_1_plen_253_part_10
MPSYYTEYEAGLGQALADPVRVFSSGAADGGREEVWTRQFEHGLVIVSSLTASNFTLKIGPPGSKKSSGGRLGGGDGLRPLPLSKNVDRISGQREAPAWQFIIDNDLHSAPAPRTRASRVAVGSNQGQWERMLGAGAQAESGARQAACVCSAAAPACCAHSAGTPSDWWAEGGRRAGFRIGAGEWTTVTDAAESHQIGAEISSVFVFSMVSPRQTLGRPPQDYRHRGPESAAVSPRKFVRGEFCGARAAPAGH